MTKEETTEVITQEDKVKAIPGKEMKEVIISMNAWLTEKKQDIIVIDKSKTDTINNLLVPIIAAIEADEAADLPEDVITFFNDHLVGLTEEEEETPSEEVEGAPTSPAKKGKDKKEKKPKKEKKEKVLKATETYNKLVKMLSADKLKMGAVKKILGNTYYGLVKKNPDVFAKDALGYFYVIGSPAEAIIIAPPVKKEKPAKKEKAPAKEKASVKEKEAEKEKALVKEKEVKKEKSPAKEKPAKKEKAPAKEKVAKKEKPAKKEKAPAKEKAAKKEKAPAKTVKSKAKPKVPAKKKTADKAKPAMSKTEEK